MPVIVISFVTGVLGGATLTHLSKSLLNNPGLIALTVGEEKREIISAVFAGKKRKIKFAFFQSDFQGGKIPYWHVADPASPSFQSTLSMEGLREWGVL